MSHKKIIGILLGFSLWGIFAGFVLTDLEVFGLCRESYTYQKGEVDNINNPPSLGCLDPISEKLGQPLAIGSMALGIIFITLLFLSKSYFTAWRKFAIWFVPLAALWVMTSPTTGGSGMGVGFGFDRELAIMWSSGIYIVVSLLILIVTAVRNKRNKEIS